MKMKTAHNLRALLSVVVLLLLAASHAFASLLVKVAEANTVVSAFST